MTAHFTHVSEIDDSRVNRFPALPASVPEQVAIKRIVAVAEEGARAAIAAPGDVVRLTGEDDTGEADHAA